MTAKRAWDIGLALLAWVAGWVLAGIAGVVVGSGSFMVFSIVYYSITDSDGGMALLSRVPESAAVLIVVSSVLLPALIAGAGIGWLLQWLFIPHAKWWVRISVVAGYMLVASSAVAGVLMFVIGGLCNVPQCAPVALAGLATAIVGPALGGAITLISLLGLIFHLSPRP